MVAAGRLVVLDGFRCIAILSVLLFHYCYRFTAAIDMDKDYLPRYGFGQFFSHGFYGVQFFFVISGFVIFQTLSRTQSPYKFAGKRAIRLLPSLVCCSILTYCLIGVVDRSNSLPFFHATTLLDFLPSITVIPPAFWNLLLNRNDIGYIDGAYWSLFPEGLFYLFGGIIYYRQPSRFIQNWVLITLLLNVIRILTSPKLAPFFPNDIEVVLSGIYNAFFMLHFTSWVYFGLGIFFYGLYVGEKPSRVSMACLLLSTFLEFYFLRDNVLRVLFIIIIGFFFTMIYRPRWLNFLKHTIFMQIGLVSYPLYLLHENIGVVLINKLGSGLGTMMTFVITILVTIILILVSKMLHEKYEEPLMGFLTRRLMK
jgi:peptidoglycan/LPS O-acetylase OafA/YrhL